MDRLDVELVRRGIFPSRQRAAAAVLAGRVLVAGEPARKAGQRVGPETELSLRAPDHPYVGRGGLKLEAALDRFGVAPDGLVCIDVGASTGGFTDCLLMRGARRVYAVDVGYGQIAWRLRNDPRVVVLERVNARRLDAGHVPEPADLAVCDVSFISLAKVLPAVGARLRPRAADAEAAAPGGVMVCLVKPQFEAGPEDVPRGGVVRDSQVHRRVLAAFAADADRLGWRLHGLMPSPVLGADGNREFLAHLRRDAARAAAEAWVDAALAEAAEPASAGSAPGPGGWRSARR